MGIFGIKGGVGSTPGMGAARREKSERSGDAKGEKLAKELLGGNKDIGTRTNAGNAGESLFQQNRPVDGDLRKELQTFKRDVKQELKEIKSELKTNSSEPAASKDGDLRKEFEAFKSDVKQDLAEIKSEIKKQGKAEKDDDDDDDKVGKKEKKGGKVPPGLEKKGGLPPGIAKKMNEGNGEREGTTPRLEGVTPPTVVPGAKPNAVIPGNKPATGNGGPDPVADGLNAILLANGGGAGPLPGGPTGGNRSLSSIDRQLTGLQKIGSGAIKAPTASTAPPGDPLANILGKPPGGPSSILEGVPELFSQGNAVAGAFKLFQNTQENTQTSLNQLRQLGIV